MKIYFKQKNDNVISPFSEFNIRDCYLKHLYIDMDTSKITRKTHHHNGFEIHIIEKGHQTYEIGDRIYETREGQFFLIPPFIKHRITNSAPGTEKYSITFTSPELSYISECITGNIPARFFENVRFVSDEFHSLKSSSERLIENSVFECTMMFLRLSGLHETEISQSLRADDLRLEHVKEYIYDNIENNITVSDIAAYCYISSKQMTRIFIKHEGIAPAQFIANARALHIQKLLEDNSLTLKEISDRMNFQNEYYFNAFVKKHLGMPPGTYRKMNK